MTAEFKSLLDYISKRRKVQLIFLTILTFFGSFLEVFSIGLIFPFITVFLDPSLVFENHYVKPILDNLSITSVKELFLPITVAFFLITTSSYIIRSVLIFARSKLSRIIIQEISSLMYWRIINENYEFHVNQNSGDIITGVSKSLGIAASLILPILRILNSSLLLFFAIIGTVFIDIRITLVIIISLFIFYYVVVIAINNKLNSYSNIQNNNYSNLIKIIQESLGAIKIIILNKAQKVFYKNYNKITNEYLRSISMVEFISLLPKLLFEYTILVVILFTIYYFRNEESLGVLIPTIITFLVAIQRLLPEVNSLYTNIVKIKTNKASVERVLNYLMLNNSYPVYKQIKVEKLSFKKALELKDVSFKYTNEEKNVISNLSLTILKGQKVGIVGESGSGKSTLIDLISGLLFPTSGQIKIDGVCLDKKNNNTWKNHVNVISQDIFLFDSTIAENIAFTNDHSLIDFQKLEEVCKISELTDFIDNLKDGIFSMIGERGVKISGGQIQRIGIARALYRSSDLLILDEATSALDQDTEFNVMEKIIKYSSSSTLIIIAHRLTTLKNCDIIFKLGSNKLEVFNNYSTLIKKIDNE